MGDQTTRTPRTALVSPGTLNVHVSSPMGSFESSPNTWEEWIGEDEYGALPYAYGSNLQHDGGFEALQTQAAWWDYIRRHAYAEGQGDPAGAIGRNERDLTDPEVQEFMDTGGYTEDFLYELEATGVLPMGTGSDSKTKCMESDGPFHFY